MKKYILIASIIFKCQICFSQNVVLDSTIVKNKTIKNEIAFNILDIIISNRIGFVYERFLNKKHSVLINIVGFDKTLNFEANPFLYQKAVSYGFAYRFYRAKNKPNSGIFISPMARIKQQFNSSSYKTINESTFELSKGTSIKVSTGLGIGGKFIKKKLTFTLQTNFYYDLIPKNVYYLTEIFEPQPIGFGLFAGFGYRF